MLSNDPLGSAIAKAVTSLLNCASKKCGQNFHLFEVPKEWALDIEVIALDSRRGAIWAVAAMVGPEAGVRRLENGTWLCTPGDQVIEDPLKRALDARDPLQKHIETLLENQDISTDSPVTVGACVAFPMTSDHVFHERDRKAPFFSSSLFLEDFEEAESGHLTDEFNAVGDTNILGNSYLTSHQVTALVEEFQKIPKSRGKLLRKTNRKWRNAENTVSTPSPPLPPSGPPEIVEEVEKTVGRDEARNALQFLNALAFWAVVPTKNEGKPVGVWYNPGDSNRGALLTTFEDRLRSAVRRNEVRGLLLPGPASQHKELLGACRRAGINSENLVDGWVLRALTEGPDASWPQDVKPAEGQEALLGLLDHFRDAIVSLIHHNTDDITCLTATARPGLAAILKWVSGEDPWTNPIESHRDSWQRKIGALVNVKPSEIPTHDVLYVVPESWLEIFIPSWTPSNSTEDLIALNNPVESQLPKGVAEDDARLLFKTWEVFTRQSSPADHSAAPANRPDESKSPPGDTPQVPLLEIENKVTVTSFRSCLDPLILNRLNELNPSACIAVAPELAVAELEIRHDLQDYTLLLPNLIPGPGVWRTLVPEGLIRDLGIDDIPDGWISWLERPYRHGRWSLVSRPEYPDEGLEGLLNRPERPRVWRLGGYIENPPLSFVAPRFGDEVLRASSPYRDTYLADVAVRALRFSFGSRVLLVLRSREDAAALKLAFEEAATLPSIVFPEESILAGGNPNGFREAKSCLVISTESAITKWILEAAEKQTEGKLFDMVLLEVLPIEWVPLVGATPNGFDDEEGTISPLADEEDAESSEGSISSAESSEFDSVSRQRHLLSQPLRQRPDILETLSGVGDLLSRNGLYIIDERLDPSSISRVAGRLPSRTLRRLPFLPDAENHHRRIRLAVSALIADDGPIKFPPEEIWDTLVQSMVGKKINLRPWQREYVRRIVAADDPPLAVQAPTGEGKSLVFQFPAIVRSLSTGRLTLVISPLKALMQEQADRLFEWGFGFTVQAITGDLDRSAVREAYRRLRSGDLAMVLVAPERFRSRSFREALKDRLSKDGGAAFWIFDEAHCISLWGQEFRPDYLYCAQEIMRLRESLQHPGKIVLASATLPSHVLDHLEQEVLINAN